MNGHIYLEEKEYKYGQNILGRDDDVERHAFNERLEEICILQHHKPSTPAKQA